MNLDSNSTAHFNRSQEGLRQKIHSFNTHVADVCGVHAALVLYQLPLLINRDTADGGNFHDGRYWTRQSIDELRKTFPYLTANQIRTAIDRLENCGYIVKGNYNRNRHDQTAWYAISDAGLLE